MTPAEAKEVQELLAAFYQVIANRQIRFTLDAKGEKQLAVVFPIDEAACSKLKDRLDAAGFGIDTPPVTP